MIVPDWVAQSLEDNPVDLDFSKKKMPSIIDQAINFGKSVYKHAQAGFPVVSEEVQKERLSICETCYKFEPQSKRCYECGCDLEEKTSWATEECPIGKWKTSDAGRANSVKPSSCCGR